MRIGPTSISQDGRSSRNVADWIASFRAKGIDPRTDPDFLDWLREDPSRELELERAEAALEFTRMLADDPAFAADLALPSSRAKTKAKRGAHFAWWGAAAAAIIAAVFTLFVLRDETYQTGIGEQKTVVLADGSAVTLNTDSRLSVAYDRSVRRVDLLQGEAFFEVASNPDRPFDVHAAGGVIRAVGTAFNVDIRKDHVRVGVLEGRISVASGPTANSSDIAPPAILEVGESVSYSENGVLAQVEHSEDAAMQRTSWMRGVIELDGATVAEAVEEYNRYTTQKIFVGSDAVADIRLSGVVKIRDTESLLFLLQQTLAVDAVRRPDGIILLPKQ
jgi:transmembrane sensor